MRNDTTACVAIGSNVEPFQRIPHCMAALTEVPDSRLIAEPGWYLTKPRGIEEQESFVNPVDAKDLGTR